MPLVDLAVDPVAAGLKPHEDPAQLFSLDFFPGTRLRSRALREGRHVPEPGSKHYTRPEPRMINRYVRMSPTLPPRVVRTFAANAFGKLYLRRLG